MPSKRRRQDWEIWPANSGSARLCYKHPARRRPVSTGTADQSSAAAIVARARDEYLDQLSGRRTTTRLTFEEAVKIYLTRKINRGETLSRQQSGFIHDLAQRLGSRELNEIRQPDLEALEAEYRAIGNCGHTIKVKVYAPFVAVRNAVLLAGYRLDEVKIQAPTDRPGKHKVRPVADADWHEAFAQAAIDLHRTTANPIWLKLVALQAVLYSSGRRLSSVMNAEFDIEKGGMTVTASKQSPSEWVDLSPNALDWLKRVASIEGPLFGYQGKKPGGALNRRIKTVCEHAGIVYMSSHESGRRAKINKGIREGVDLNTIQRGVGHVEGSPITRKVYVSSSDENVKDFMTS